MKKLSLKSKEIRERLRGYPGILLLLDFDGTLSPIVKDPKDAILPPENKLCLQRLKKRQNIRIGIVTGRSLKDIVKRAGLKGIIYAANHGMEIYSGGRVLLNMGPHFRKPLERIADRLEPALEGIEGIIIEKKGLSVSVHFRKVSKSFYSKVERIVKNVTAPFLEKLKLTSGKKIWEIRPADFWNKGKAALWIWKRLAPSFIPVFVGDDQTDEDAFAAMRDLGITIRIRQKMGSKAEYYANSFDEITENL